MYGKFWLSFLYLSASVSLQAQTATVSQELHTPDLVLAPVFAPQFGARAIAPPTGDLAISTLNLAPLLKLDNHEPVTLTLKDAPVREVLTLLARRAGLNIIFSGNVTGKTISLDVQADPLEQTFNLILRLAGLKAQRTAKTLLIGTESTNEVMTVRTFRLNQANVVQVLPQIQGLLTQLQEPVYGSTDTRTNALTLVGSPRALTIAAAHIAQLDVRQRQVLVSLKLVDVDLLDTQNLGVGFAAQLGQFAFGSLDTGRVGTPTTFVTFPNTTLSSTGTVAVTGTTYVAPLPNSLLTQGQVITGGVPAVTSVNTNPIIGPIGVLNNFISTFDSGLQGIASQIQTRLQASIQAGNSKLLADPKIVLQSGDGVSESSGAQIDMSDDVIVGTQIRVDPATGLTTTTIQKDKAGVILDVAVFNIDDNGYVSLALKPSVTSIVSTQRDAANNLVTLLSRRNIEVKRLRLRDGQTLVMAGLVQDQALTSSNKVPFLGDLPLLGILFRSESVINRKRELALLVTPYILKDPVSPAEPAP